MHVPPIALCAVLACFNQAREHQVARVVPLVNFLQWLGRVNAVHVQLEIINLPPVLRIVRFVLPVDIRLVETVNAALAPSVNIRPLWAPQRLQVVRIVRPGDIQATVRQRAHRAQRQLIRRVQALVLVSHALLATTRGRLAQHLACHVRQAFFVLLGRHPQ